MHDSPFPPHVGFSAVHASALGPAQPHPEEMALLGDHVVPSRRRAYALGRVAAHQAMAHLTPRPGPVLCGADRAPRWPAGVVGAITHVADWALAAADEQVRTRAIGLDLAWLPELRGTGIARLVGDADELQWVGDDARRLLALFSAKESIFKALYPSYGAYFGFDAVTLRWTERPSAGFDARLRQPLGPHWPAGTPLHAGVRWHGDFVLTWVWLPAEPVPG